VADPFYQIHIRELGKVELWRSGRVGADNCWLNDNFRTLSKGN
jgi:hypothetical protein